MARQALWHDRLGWNVDEIASEFNLNLADIYAALSYYSAHRETIDLNIKVGESFVEEFQGEHSSILKQKLPGKV